MTTATKAETKVKKDAPAKKAKARRHAANPIDTTGTWYLLNAENQVLGRLAVKVATLLSGKNRPEFLRHKDMGAHVVVINVAKIRVTGNKLKDKMYKRFTQYPSGLIETPLERMLVEKPGYPLQHAVQGMLPKNSLGNHMMKKLLIYTDAVHPHAAQKPVEIKLN